MDASINLSPYIPKMILEGDKLHSQKISIGHTKTCDCKESHINCMEAKEWMKSQIGVWEFYYEKRDIRDKNVHPATFPISLARKVIELFTHEGELVLDPFVGSGTTLIACALTGRKGIGVDIDGGYCELAKNRLLKETKVNRADPTDKIRRSFERSSRATFSTTVSDQIGR